MSESTPKDLGSTYAAAMAASMSEEFLSYCRQELIHPYPIYWQFWQASRAAVVVDLSKHHGGHVLQGTERMFLSDVVGAIEAAGLKVAP